MDAEVWRRGAGERTECEQQRAVVDWLTGA